MAYLPNLQEPKQSTTQGALFSWPEQSEKENQANIPFSVSTLLNLILNLQDLLVAKQMWEAVNALVYGSSHFKDWKNSLSSTTLFYDSGIALEDILSTDPLANIQLFRGVYNFRRPEEVSMFLSRCPFLVPLLQEAHIKISKYFPKAILFLEVIADPEVINEEQLVVFIVTDLDPEIASEKLDRFDDEWWLDVLEQAQGKMCITLEFR